MEREQNIGNPRHVLINAKPTIPDWTNQRTDTTWWSLSNADLLSGGSAPQPPREYRKADIPSWLKEVARFRQELPCSPPSWDSSSEVVYIGEVSPNCRDLQQQHQATRSQRASSIIAVPNPAPATNTCEETQRQIRQGQARLLRADVDIRSIKKSTSQLYSSASVLPNRPEDRCIRDPVQAT